MDKWAQDVVRSVEGEEGPTYVKQKNTSAIDKLHDTHNFTVCGQREAKGSEC
jgi:hypothetical protein